MNLPQTTSKLENHMIEVWNKIDQLPAGISDGAGIGVSALTGAGIPHLLEILDKRLSDLFMTVLTISILPEEGEKLAWLYRNGTVLSQTEKKEKF